MARRRQKRQENRMRKAVISLGVVFVLGLIPGAVFGHEHAKCVGADPCRACSNCSRCAHCSAGGTCGVCKPRAEPKPTPSPKPKPKDDKRKKTPKPKPAGSKKL